MKTYTNLWKQLCSYSNLDRAFHKARKRKTKKLYVKEFEENLDDNLTQLQLELYLHIYKPKPLTTFIIRDPKTRKISKADFRDRVIHHALCNVIEPLFDQSFIHDSYANRKRKGTLRAIQRFDQFKRKICNKHTQTGCVLKADIKHYFDRIDHQILMQIIKKKMTVVNSKNKKMTVDAFIKQAQKVEPNFWIRYAVFRDMRMRGYIVKTALKFGADFRVYDRGIKPGEDHAKWILYPVHEGETQTWYEFSAKNRVAHSTRKNLLIGIVDDEGDVTYYTVSWTRP